MRFLLSLIALTNGGVITIPPAAQPVVYQFKNQTSPVYEYTIRTELPDQVDTQSGHIFLAIKSVDPANGQITLSCSREFQTDRQLKTQDGQIDPASHSRTQSPRGPFPDPTTAPDMVIDQEGKPIRSVLSNADQPLPDLLGPAWQLPLQPLPPEGQTTWKTDRDTNFYQRVQRPGGPSPFGQQQPQELIAQPAHETINYAVASADDNAITITRQIEMDTDEKVGTVPAESLTGDGQYVFDRHAGLLRSLDFKLTIQANENNISVRIPATVTMRLLSDVEVTKLKADRQAAVANARSAHEKLRAQFALQHANDASDIPPGSVETEMVGGHGGGPYIKVNKDKLDVIGFSIRMGNWAGHTVLGGVDPLYEAPADMNPDNATICVAKPGYVVGGITVNDQDGAAGMEVIFMKKTPTGLNITDTYTSPWFGYTQGTRHTLAGHGDRVIGTFGRQGMNMDAIGLVLIPAQSPAANDAPAHSGN